MMFTVALHSSARSNRRKGEGEFSFFKKEYSLSPVLLFDLGWDAA
jgi:hypothetical protein